MAAHNLGGVRRALEQERTAAVDVVDARPLCDTDADPVPGSRSLQEVEVESTDSEGESDDDDDDAR